MLAWPETCVTRLGDLLDFGQLFKAFGDFLGTLPETHYRAKDHPTASLQLYEKKIYGYYLVCSEAVETKVVKLDTNCTVILPSTVSVLWLCNQKVSFH